MNKTYTINIPQLTVTVNTGLNNIPFYVWRDCCRHCYISDDTVDNITFTCHSVESIQKIEQVLQGALFALTQALPSDNG